MRIENHNGTENTKILEPGDKIKCQGIFAQIATIHYQDYDPYRDEFIAEFYDTNGNIRNWHQHSDGGIVIPKPNEKKIYVGFEKSDSRGNDNINNYDAMKIFETEQEAIVWRNNNPEYRVYKYCGKVAV